VTLLALAAERRAATRPVAAAVDRQADPAHRALSSKPATHCGCDRMMGPTDGRTLDRFIDPVPQFVYYATSVSNVYSHVSAVIN